MAQTHLFRAIFGRRVPVSTYIPQTAPEISRLFTPPGRRHGTRRGAFPKLTRAPSQKVTAWV